MAISDRHRLRMRYLVTGLPLLIAVDALMGLGYHTNTDATVVVIPARSGVTRRAIVVFPGYVMPGETLGKAFAPHIADSDAIVVVSYAERDVDATQISDHVMQALDNLKPIELRVYGASMGGMVGVLFLEQYGKAGAPYGKVIFLLDSAPASRKDIKRSSWLLDTSCWYRGGPLSSLVWVGISTLLSKPPSEANANQDIIRNARRAGAWIGMPAVTSQACFIANYRQPQESPLHNIVQQAVFIEGSSPEDDPLVRVGDAIADWRKTFPDLKVVTLAQRKGQWHLPLVEFPQETVKAITAREY